MKKLLGAIFGLTLAASAAPEATFAAFDSADFNQVKPLEILRITPEGDEADAGNQVVFEFNRPVVPVGQMERKASEIPIEITPKLDCHWMWLNTSSLSCNLDGEKRLKMSTHYNVVVHPGIKAEDNTTIAADYNHEFTTRLPDATYESFQKWIAPAQPQFYVNFNQPVTKDSVEKAIFMQDVSGKQVAVKAEPTDPKQKVTEVNGKRGRDIWIISAKDELTPDSDASMKISPGLEGLEGPEKGKSEGDIITFHTHPGFKFLGIKCHANDGNDVFIKPGQRQDLLCNPLGGAAIAFSSPVSPDDVKKHVKILNDKGKNLWENVTVKSTNETEESDDEEEEGSNGLLGTSYTTDTTYNVWLPNLDAAKTYKVVIANPDYNIFYKFWRWIKSIFVKQPLTEVEDLFERPLMDAVSLDIKTDHRLPNFVIANDPAVLEAGIDSEVPLYVNNVDSASFTYNSLGAKGMTYTYDIPKVRDIQFAIPFNIRNMLGGRSGALYGTLHTSPKIPGANNLFAEVTPYQVHAKIGHFNSFVWVTEFATGKVVSDAKVTIYKDVLSQLNGGAGLGVATTGADGTAILPGTDALDPQLENMNNWDRQQQSLFVKIEKSGEIALLPLMGDFEIYNYYGNDDYGAYPNPEQKYGHIKTWGTTAQGVYHASDTIQYKIYVRNQDNKTLVAAPRGSYKLTITDPTDNVVETVDGIQLNEFGALQGEYTVPSNAKLGWYGFQLSGDFAPNKSWYPARVLVSDFTPAPFKVTNQLNGNLFKKDDEVKVETFAKLHSGGPYTDANVRISGIISQSWFAPDNPKIKGYEFNSYNSNVDQIQAFEKSDKLNDKGEFESGFKLDGQGIYYGHLMVESAVQDDRGKSYAATSSAVYAGVDRLVGLKSSGWIYDSNKPVNMNYVVVDANGQLQDDTEVTLNFEQEVVTTAKVKSAGNAYTSENNTTWQKVGGCEAEAKAADNVCSFTPKQSGTYRAVGLIKDTKGREHRTELTFYVSGSDYVLWNDESDTALTIIPEKTSYKVGETAKYLVKNPYPGAEALITIERYGVIDHFVQKLNDSAATIEFPIKPEYMPGFYMSVTIFSGRADKPVKDQVDLGKPAFRAGYVTVPVNDVYKQMDVTASTDKKEYRPGEMVTLELKAAPKTADKKEPIEFAVAVLDESVLDLIAGGKEYYDPYKGLYSLDGLDVRNFSLLTRLVGRQKFEKKGANPGGDGGANLSMRDVFKYVSYWNPSIKADANGEAAVDFKLPDNLTGWRVLAIATTPTDRVGLGDYNFKTNKKTQVIAAMPNQVTEGDDFDAAFTVMNRTDKPRDIEVKIVAGDKTLTTQKVKIDSYKRVVVKAPVSNAKAGEMVFKVYATDAVDNDAMTQKLTINKRRSYDTAATYGTTEKGAVSESLQVPKNIYPDVGGISIVTSSTIIANVDGAFEYMRDYPYICWEQKITKAVMAAHYKNLQNYLSVRWDAGDITQKTLDIAAQNQAPSGGMSYYIADDLLADPFLSAYTAISFNWLRRSGYNIPQNVEQKLHAYLKNFLANDTAPQYYNDGMVASVRAVALNALAQDGEATIDDIQRYQPHFKNMSLFGKANFMQAAMQIPGAEKITEDSAKNILAYANQSGGKFTFTESLDEVYSRILDSELRSDCAVLSAFVQYGEGAGSNLVGDVPFKLVRQISAARGTRNYWDNTQENMYCMNALTDYARIYEKEIPAMNVDVKLDNASIGTAKFTSFTDVPVTSEKAFSESSPGKHIKLDITKTGAGRLYYAARMKYALRADSEKATNAGIEIKREYSIQRGKKFEPLNFPAEIKQGDLVKVDLYVTLPAARDFVVVDDPVPGGLEPVNRDLANSSSIDADAASSGGWNEYGGYDSFYFRELRNDRVVYYSDYLSEGKYHLSYTAQAVASGKFSVMPVKAEEMYDPDVYGKGITGILTVK